MLRITAVEDDRRVTLMLEGRIVFDWVETLHRECEEHLSRSREVVLDFAGVSFVDCDAVVLLDRLSRRGISLTRCSPFLEELIHEQCKRRLSVEGVPRAEPE